MQHVGNGGQRLHHDAAGRQRRFDLPQRDPSLARHDGPQVVRVLLQQGTPVAPNLRWRCAAGLAHPLHQLDGRRGAHGKAAGRLPDRAATLDNSHDPLTQVLGQRCGHDQLHRSHPQHPGSRTLDSVQARTALVAMDNLAVHKVAGVKEAIRAAGASVLYLPSYSPDFNPIEQFFAKLKALLRKAAARTQNALWETIGTQLDDFTPAECQNYGSWPLSMIEPGASLYRTGEPT